MNSMQIAAIVLVAIGCCGALARARDDGCLLDGSQLKDFERAVSKTRFETNKIRPKITRCQTFAKRIREADFSETGYSMTATEPISLLSEIAKVLEPKAACSGPVNGVSSLLEFVSDCIELMELTDKAAGVHHAGETSQEQLGRRVAELESRLAAALSDKARAVQELESKDAVREITLEGDNEGMVLVPEVLGSAFVGNVLAGFSAAQAGMRFGDQVIAVNSEAPAKKTYLVRKCPFEIAFEIPACARGQTTGVSVHDGSVVAVERESPAARAGVVTGVRIITINGQYVVGLTDQYISWLLKGSLESTTKLTVLPNSIFKALTGWMGKAGHELKWISEEGNKIVESD